MLPFVEPTRNPAFPSFAALLQSLGPSLPGVEIGRGHTRAAIATFTHLAGGGVLPFVLPFWTYCPFCKTLGTTIVRAAFFDAPGRLELERISCGHHFVFPLGLESEIQAWTLVGQLQDLGAIHHVVASRSYSLHRLLRRISFDQPPTNYFSPETLLIYALYGLETPRNFRPQQQVTGPFAYFLGEMAKHDPIAAWIHPHVAEAVADSIAPEIQLDQIQWFQYRSLFFLPPGALQTPDGQACPVIGYCVIPNGCFSVLDLKESFLNIGSWLLIWALDPQGNVHHFVQFPLRGSLAEFRFRQKHSPEANTFYRRLIDWVLIFNYLCLTPQAKPPQMRLVQLSQPTKKERRKQLNEPRKRFSCPWLSFKPTTPKPRQQGSGQRMPPHNKPGWLQRYHSRNETRWVYRPPHRANAYLDPP